MSFRLMFLGKSQYRRPGLAQRAIERFPGNLDDQRLQQPAQSKRNVAGQRQGLTLHVDAAVCQSSYR